MLLYCDVDTQSANLGGNPLRQMTKHTTVKWLKKKKKRDLCAILVLRRIIVITSHLLHVVMPTFFQALENNSTKQKISHFSAFFTV